MELHSLLLLRQRLPWTTTKLSPLVKCSNRLTLCQATMGGKSKNGGCLSFSRKNTTTTITRACVENPSECKFQWYDSQGDYWNDELALGLRDSQLPLYSQQASLPSLPVPTLNESIATFLPSALPLAESEQEAFDLKTAVEKFPRQAKFLQERLIARAANSPTSWLQEWWNTKGYLQVRSSNVLHVSYFFRLGHHNSVKMTAIKRAAAILHGTVQFATSVLDGTKSPNMINSDTPLCSAQLKYMFNACRIPTEKQDCYRIYNCRHNQQHAVVALCGQFYCVPLTANDGSSYSQRTIHDMLNEICRKYRQPSAALEVPELGWLTTQNRDDWCRDYKRLLETDSMQQALHTLQSGLIMLCLDDTPSTASDRHFAETLWHSGAENRWHDKSIQIIVATDGRMGLIGEHSMADGMPAVDYSQFVRELTFDHSALASPTTLLRSPTPKAVNIFQGAFEALPRVDQLQIRERVNAAKTSHFQATDCYDLQILQYTGAGTLFFKQAAISPDAVVQMAMQLAAYRYFGNSKTVGTYESAQTRRFRHGRTETTRTVSPYGQAFCLAMTEHKNGVSITATAVLELLQCACDFHQAYNRKAVRGLGCDRHFFGLANLLLPSEAAPDLFSNPLYLRSKRWLLSTSTLPGTAPGFGPAEAEGFGIGYDIQQDQIIFTVTTEKEHNCAESFCRAIATALDDIKQLLAIGRDPQHSKL